MKNAQIVKSLLPKKDEVEIPARQDKNMVEIEQSVEYCSISVVRDW